MITALLPDRYTFLGKLLIFVALLLYPLVASMARPDRHEYMTTETVFVHDGCGGDSFMVDADGVFLQDFAGTYRAWYIDENGSNVTPPPEWKLASDAQPYRAGEAYIGLKSLNWWSHPTSGDLEAGTYKLYTEWRIFLGGAFIQFGIMSNQFTIRDCGASAGATDTNLTRG